MNPSQGSKNLNNTIKVVDFLQFSVYNKMQKRIEGSLYFYEKIKVFRNYF